MVFVPATILGGLPVIANVWFTGAYDDEPDSGVDALHWQKRDGSRGKEVSQAIYDRCDKYDQWWQAVVTEQANDWLSMNCPVLYRDQTAPGGYREEGEWSEEYIKLNGDPRQRKKPS